jgi:hypothetical protein
MRRVFAPPPRDAASAAALFEREKLVKEQVHRLGGASYRQRSGIEAELAAIHRLLVGLGLRARDAS